MPLLGFGTCCRKSAKGGAPLIESTITHSSRRVGAWSTKDDGGRLGVGGAEEHYDPTSTAVTRVKTIMGKGPGSFVTKQSAGYFVFAYSRGTRVADRSRGR